MKILLNLMVLAIAGINAGPSCSAFDRQGEAVEPLSWVRSPPSPVLSAVTSELAAEINREEARVSAGIKAGDLSVAGSLHMDSRISIHRFRLTHPVLTFGFVERGDLLRLICNPGGSWNRVPVWAVARTARVRTGKAAPEKYGIVVSPFPRALSFFSFYEPEINSSGAIAGFRGDFASGELLAVFSRPSAPYLPDHWLLEQKPPGAEYLMHGLLRLSATHGILALSGGVALSASRHTIPQIAASSTIGIALSGFELLTTVSGATRGYFDIKGKPAGVPLLLSYKLSAGKYFPVRAFLKHEIRLETLPLVRIPFRTADETLRLGVELEVAPLTVGASAEARIRTERTAVQELSGGAGVSAELALRSGRIGLVGEVSAKSEPPWGFSVRLPVKLEAGDLALSTEASLSGREVMRLGLSAELRGRTKSRVSWYVAAGVATELRDIPAAQGTAKNSLNGSGSGATAPVDLNYRIGWRARS